MTALAAAPATAPAADRLAELEGVIAHGMSEFIRVGEALREIRDLRLYLASYSSFREYMLARWHFGEGAAFGKIYASACADAIVASGAALPAGIAENAVKPLIPLLNQQGAEAVGRAWRIVEQRHGDQRRPPSAGDVRAALNSAGFITSAPPKPKPHRLEPVADRLRTALRRVVAIVEQLDGRPLSPGTRQRAAELAALAREVADALDRLADVSMAATRLQALERKAEPQPELSRAVANGVSTPRAETPEAGLEPEDELADLCLNHGADRDARGVCASCGRPDLYKPGLNGERTLAQAG